MKRIMIVEDAELLSDLMMEILNLNGFDVIGQAYKGSDSISMFEELRPDIVLMDIILPDMSGIDAARRITELDGRARIIAITALSHRDIRDECIEVGCMGFLVKPFRMKELINAVKAVADRVDAE
ncbi:MAG: response regulator [Thermoplasmatota archaeon]